MSLNFYFLPRCLPSFLSPNCYLIADIVLESFLEPFRKLVINIWESSMHYSPNFVFQLHLSKGLPNYQLIFGGP